ncbi:MAG: capsule assembly Wzi family protein [Candidatus Neomarinimicrobiota bacterium]|nr:capsule assembly Wzi family protein [Candidatus Neomarinimicrobiota bacterium]
MSGVPQKSLVLPSFLNIGVMILAMSVSIATAQVLIRGDSMRHMYDIERRSILRGRTDSYLSLRYRHEWRNAAKGGGDLLSTERGDDLLRNDRFRIYPELSAALYAAGGHLQKKGLYIDLAPTVTLVGRYSLSTDKLLSITGWTRLEKHSMIAPNEFGLEKEMARPVLNSEFSWDAAIGWSDMPGSDNSWIEYRLGAGGATVNYPGGDLTFGKTVPIWSSGYAGQLWFSNKTSSLTFFAVRHRLSERWSFAFLHGSLNSSIRDSTYTGYYPKGGGLPLIQKLVAVHRLDFTPVDNVRIGIGESVVYGGRGLESAYVLPFVPYWTAQADLSNSDNLQIVIDWEVIKRKSGRFYGTLYLDEWDLVNTFSGESSRNWAAALFGGTVNLQSLPWKPLLRLEWAHLTPYVYVHRSPVNTFEHYGAPLGHWIGPNGNGIFLSTEGRPSADIWGQFYVNIARRGEVDEESINRQYRHEKVPFFYRTYEGEQEQRIVVGVRGEWSVGQWGRIKIDLFASDWRQHRLPDSLGRGSTRKIDGTVQIVLGL